MRTRLPWIVWAIAIALAVPGAITVAIAISAPPSAIPWIAAQLLLALCTATAGAVVATRLPTNAVGWILLAIGVGTGIMLVCIAYAELGFLNQPDPHSSVVYASWVTYWIGVPTFYGSTAFLLLLFPDGHLPSPRWRWVARFVGTAIIVATVASALWPAKLDRGFANPLTPQNDTVADFLHQFYDATDWLAPPIMLASAAGLVVRLHRSRGAERLQLKWFAYVATVAAIALATSVIGPPVISDVAFLGGLVALVGFPITIGMAILRYRLYAIDVVINRTLVYGTLTVALGAAYLAGVLLFQLALSPLTKESGLAIAASTLAVAALFRPARTKIQGLVDRRFYRHRYDARRTLDEFGVRLRHELDLETLAADLRGVVHDTMQPAHVSLWLRRTDRNDSRTAPL